MSRPSLKQQLFAQLALVGKAVSHGHRLELLEHLAQGERTVEVLAKLTNLSVANASQHLRGLRQNGLVMARKQGQHVFYALVDDQVVSLINALRRVAETHLAEVERLVHTYLTVKDELEPVPKMELLERAAHGLVTVLDVRPPEEYQSGHLPGAINIPLKELEQRLKELPPDQQVVAYCRGPYCVLAYEAVAKLREKGFDARRLEDGFPEWRQAGLPVENSGNSSMAVPGNK
ncbi:MAG: ArsR/SmtB family transcription factor [Sulfuricaulis sp.]